MSDSTAKTIIRVQKNRYFSVISNVHLNDVRLSWKGKGLLTYLLSKPDDWEIHVKHLIKQSSDGRDSTYSGIRELINTGYIVKQFVRDSGRIKGLEYIVIENPGTSAPAKGPETGNQQAMPVNVVNAQSNPQAAFTETIVNTQSVPTPLSDLPLTVKQETANPQTAFTETIVNTQSVPTPPSDLPFTEKSYAEKSYTENRTLLSTDFNQILKNDERLSSAQSVTVSKPIHNPVLSVVVVSLLELLKEPFKNDATLESLINRHLYAGVSQDQIAAAIGYANKKCTAKNVTGYRAYLDKSITGGSGISKSERDREMQQEQKRQLRITEQKKRLLESEIVEAAERNKIKMSNKLLETLSDEQKEHLRALAIENLTSNMHLNEGAVKGMMRGLVGQFVYSAAQVH